MVPPERIEQLPPELLATMLFWRTTLLLVPATEIPVPELPLTVQLLRMTFPPTPIEFIVLLLTLAVPPGMTVIPAPLPLKVLWLIVTVPYQFAKLLPLKVLRLIVAVWPRLKMPLPPDVAEFPEMVLLLTVSAPWL